MAISKVFRSFVFVFTVSIFAFNTALAEKCETIHFKRGESSGTINGIAPPDDVKCYKMTTGQGQTATLRVVAGKNIIFSIDGLVEAQDAYTFTTDRKTYKIYVGQLMRSIADEPFTLFVSVE